MGSSRARILAAAAVLLNLLVLFAPRAPSVSTGGLPVDKVVHLLVFAWPTVALIRLGLPRRWVVLGMAAWAPLSELVQWRLLDQRSGNPLDVVADLLGVSVGIWLARSPRGGDTRPDPGVTGQR